MHTHLPVTLMIETVRARLADGLFWARHRTTPRAFTRQRKLPFDRVVLPLGPEPAEGLCHSAFIELNEAAVLAPLAAVPEALARWQGHRLLALDSSLLRLPASAAVWAHFGGQEAANQSGPCGVRVPPQALSLSNGQARLSVLYDVLNRLGLDARVGGFATSEEALAQSQLGLLHPGDLVLVDRGYPGYAFCAQIAARGAHFVGRCPRRSFAAAAALFARDAAGVSQTVTLQAPARARAAGLPAQLRVRLVTVRLATGELEVLATSLLAEEDDPTASFLELYGQRWGIETYYGVLKGRLDLENFSGQSVEAILQEVHAAVFLSNLESVIAAQAAEDLPQAGEGGRRHAAQINRAVSFHALKSRAMALLLGPAPVEEVLGQLRALFLANPVSVRPHRRPPRRAPSALRSHHFQKRVRKIVF